jgi:FtsP/CotA-like multicopper oxidase with cupredoxin domain
MSMNPRRREMLLHLRRTAGLSVLPVSASWLSGCADADVQSTTSTSAASVDPTAASDLSAKGLLPVNQASYTVRMQARKVQWQTGKSPAQNNAWVYAQDGVTPSGVLASPMGPAFNARRGVPVAIKWVNEVMPVGGNPALMPWPPLRGVLPNAMCGSVTLQSPVGLVTHLHGARAMPSVDGNPLTPLGLPGNPYGFPTNATYVYPNAQRAALLWYHDHSLDNTAQNVYSGLVGTYAIRDAYDDAVVNLIGGSTKEITLVLSDKILSADLTTLDYEATVPSTGPAQRPESLGKSIFVNGHPGAAKSLDRTVWRLRFVNSSNARTYALALCDVGALNNGAGRIWYSDCMRLIGADGGLMSKSVKAGATDFILLAPGQRKDILLDLTFLPAGVSQLRLVNLALTGAMNEITGANGTLVEPIFTTSANSVMKPSQANYNALDSNLYHALQLSVAPIMDLRVTTNLLRLVSNALFETIGLPVLESTLAQAASDDDFVWNGSSLGARSGRAFGPNRLVLPISNTSQFAADAVENGVQGWSDVQLFEMQDGAIAPSADNAYWHLPFNVNLSATANPIGGQPSANQVRYTIGRRSFFGQRRNPDITVARRYPAMAAPVIKAKGGTYERWYVANIGNSQPLALSQGLPDMHPFHIHLVNFVVTQRWNLGANDQFQALPASALELDKIARQDTVIILSGQLVELLVYYPPGYAGEFVYHCHIFEHEDKCMMSTFAVA